MKHESRPYNTNLERKLEQLPGVDADHLWDDMHAILDKKMPEKREKRRFIFWFLNDRGLFSVGITLLITATAFCLFFLSPNRNSSTNTNIATNKLPNPAQQNKTNETAVNSEDVKQSAASQPDNIKDSQIIEASTLVGSRNRARNHISQQKNTWSNYTITTSANTESTQQDNGIAANQITQQANPESDHVVTDSISQHDSYITSEDFNPVSHDVAMNEQEKNSLEQRRAPAPQTQSPKQNIRVQKEKGLYAGIVAGMDLSSVRFQSVGAGASQGLILGYAFNNRWSVESGVLWDKKRYYDDGSNFNPPGYTPTPSVQIISVNGTNKNYEWPINVRYTIIPRKNSLFATAGLSSYFMKSEHFEYEYVQNSQPGGHNYITYTNATKNWFSVVNFSLGYSHKLGSVGSLRIEPYFKVPIKNLGTANMPIMSTGLNIGFTRCLSR
jgi:hypothetical protein